MGSHVTMDVPAFIRVAGNPTKQAGVNSVGMERKAFSKDQIANIKKAYKIFYRENLRVEDAVERIKAEGIRYPYQSFSRFYSQLN